MLPRGASHLQADATHCEAIDLHCDALASRDETSDKHSDTLTKASLEMALKLEAANYRIGWLESQLHERENDVEELKLLTDSQRKNGWWHKVRSWFAGQ